MDEERLNCFVIIADDYPPDLDLLQRTLTTMTHFRVAFQSLDGAQVIAYLQGEPPFNNRKRFPFPHLLILDLKMPHPDGFEVLQWIQTHHVPRLVTVALTGSEDPDHFARAKALGADAVIIKPITLTHIRDMVSHIERFMETAPKGITC